MKRLVVPALIFLLSAGVALASWYDDYEAGMKAVAAGQWQVVIQKMTAAIGGNSKENNSARTYGAIFINYHPFYYRGLAYLRTGKYEQAISDFEKTTGPGEVDRGSIENLMAEAKSKQAAATAPEPQPQPVPVPAPQPVRPAPVPVPTPVQPAAPAIDPAVRQQVNAAIAAANQSLAAARGRNAAASSQYQQAMAALVEANSRIATAKSNDDLQAALGSANNAKIFAESAMPPGVPTPTRPTVATQIVLSDTTKRIHQAFVSYFNGDFDDASSQFSRLSQEMPKNGWIWAFLGASQYSQYAFEADESYKSQALQSFRKAKQIRTWKNGLPEKYFSKRIRRVFSAS